LLLELSESALLSLVDRQLLHELHSLHSVFLDEYPMNPTHQDTLSDYWEYKALHRRACILPRFSSDYFKESKCQMFPLMQV
jgi:hypothetical protein